MRRFRLLKEDEIECRVAMINEKGLQLLLYKTARTDYALLDETVGAENWQNDYKEVSGNVYCGIGILMDGKWIWKWNCGSESNMEAEKGEASDAMKRAGFAWGIGTELYSSPWIWVKAENCNIEQKNGRYVCNDKFVVTGIDYDEKERINFLAIDNTKKHCAAFLTEPKRKQKTVTEKVELPPMPDEKQLRQEILAIAPKKGIKIDDVIKASYDGLSWEELKAESLIELKRRMLKRSDV